MRRSWEKLLKELEELGCLESPGVREAFLKIPRSAFAPGLLAEDSARNVPLMLPCGATLSAPYIFAFVLAKAQVEKGNKVFLFDAGSGWEAAVIAALAGASSLSRKPVVFAREPSEETRQKAGERARAFPENRAIAFFSDESLALSEAPFDRIIALQKPGSGVLDSWKRMVSTGGRIVAPQGENLIVLESLPNGKWEERRFFGMHFSG